MADVNPVNASDSARRQEESAVFSICEFPDLRTLLAAQAASGAIEDTAEDFGLCASTDDDALEFLRQAVLDTNAADAMTEFLDDDGN